eukprot:scaffold17579_cov134-Isochrysis_galbana.AAC.3
MAPALRAARQHIFGHLFRQGHRFDAVEARSRTAHRHQARTQSVRAVLLSGAGSMSELRHPQFGAALVLMWATGCEMPETRDARQCER